MIPKKRMPRHPPPSRSLWCVGGATNCIRIPGYQTKDNIFLTYSVFKSCRFENTGQRKCFQGKPWGRPSMNSSREPRLENAPFMARKKSTPARFCTPGVTLSVTCVRWCRAGATYDEVFKLTNRPVALEQSQRKGPQRTQEFEEVDPLGQRNSTCQ